MIVAFTGHRPEKLPMSRLIQIEEWLKAQLVELKPEKAITGMAQGVDMFGFFAARDLSIPIVAAVPWPGHALSSGWRDNTVNYFDRLDEAAEVHVVCEEDVYRPWFYQKRNEWMVDNCDILLAVWDGSSGGTANCVKYAQKVGREIRFFPWNVT